MPLDPIGWAFGSGSTSKNPYGGFFDDPPLGGHFRSTGSKVQNYYVILRFKTAYAIAYAVLNQIFGFLSFKLCLGFAIKS
jgi:hypothetical protein